MGPGSLPTDSAMIGLTPTDTRELIAENLDIIVRLLRGESVTATTRTHTLVDAQLQLAPYTDPCFDAAVTPPTGPRMAGQHCVGLLSIGAILTPDGFDALAHDWGVVEERAAHYGQPAPDRSTWRLVGGIGVIGTPEDAKAQVRKLWEQSNGGFAAMLLLGHEWAKLVAQYVVPEFQNQSAATQLTAVAHMTEKHQQELADKG